MNKPPCSECQKPLVRRPGEHGGNWKRRITCSQKCATLRDNRLRAWSDEDTAIAIRMNSEGCGYDVIGQRLSRRRSGETVRAKLRSLLRPTPPSSKIPCLKCGKPFTSVDKCRNRICAKCNYRNQEAYDNTACVGDLV